MDVRDVISLGLLVVALAAAAASWTSAIAANRSANEARRQRNEAAEDRRIERGRGLSIGVTWTVLGEEGFAQRYVEPVLECINASAASVYRDIEVVLREFQPDPLNLLTAERTFRVRELLPMGSQRWALAPRGTEVIYTPDDVGRLTPVWEARFSDGHGERWTLTSSGELSG
ncbi:hypothetical protein [Nocardioides sambongensis]|uniref:hypothetical protein n=1 Tax=Nocardioides sambongensis TaxID=2589074 RepID=UPI001127A19F|nr:hypothetical protein [Nocardioides sambongensis]